VVAALKLQGSCSSRVALNATNFRFDSVVVFIFCKHIIIRILSCSGSSTRGSFCSCCFSPYTVYVYKVRVLFVAKHEEYSGVLVSKSGADSGSASFSASPYSHRKQPRIVAMEERNSSTQTKESQQASQLVFDFDFRGWCQI
jgi:hypothetical protein